MNIPMGFSPDQKDEIVAFLEQECRNGEALAESIGDIARVLLSKPEQLGWVADKFQRALSDWLTLSVRQQIRKIKTAPGGAVGNAVYIPTTKDPVEELTRLVAERDRLQQAVEAYERTLARAEDHKDDNPGIELMMLGIGEFKNQVVDRLQWVEKTISALQTQLESSAPADLHPNETNSRAGGQA